MRVIPTRIAILSAMAALVAIGLTAIGGTDGGAHGSDDGRAGHGYRVLAGPGHQVVPSTVGFALTVEGGTHSGHHVHGRG
jgi:hypothetical protein